MYFIYYYIYYKIFISNMDMTELQHNQKLGKSFYLMEQKHFSIYL